MLQEPQFLFEHYLLLVLSILPFIYKYCFWLFTIQLKEYRWDRFKEYISTPQWKTAIVNMWSVLELPLFLAALFVFIDRPFEIIIFNVLFIFLLIQNLFVFRKLVKRNILHPKITGRLLLISIVIVWGLFLDLQYLIENKLWHVTYAYILFVLLFPPIIIYIANMIIYPLVWIWKILKINKAKKKSQSLDKVIKIWITGSYWKSSVKEYLSSILEQKEKTLKTPDNINTELWVSNVILQKLDNTYKYFVAEMWAYKRWEIDLLWKIVNHQYWFLTAVWNQHLWLFWSLKNIRHGKAEIANSVLRNNGTLYINWNNSQIRKHHFDKNLNIVKYWNYDGSDTNYKIKGIKNAITEFDFKYNKQKATFKTSLVWEHNIINITWVLAFCYDIWFTTTELKEYIQNLSRPKNTLDITHRFLHDNHQLKDTDFETDGWIPITLINDTHNLSEESLLVGLDVLLSFDGEKILVVDDILELWSISKDYHYEIGKQIAKKYSIDKVLYTWVNYKKFFLDGLLNWWFKDENIIDNLDTINTQSVILFEWRGTRKYLNNIIKDVS